MLEDEPTHLVKCSIVRDESILPITVNRTGVLVFWECLKQWAHEIHHMSLVVRETLLMELSTVETEYE